MLLNKREKIKKIFSKRLILVYYIDDAAISPVLDAKSHNQRRIFRQAVWATSFEENNLKKKKNSD